MHEACFWYSRLNAIFFLTDNVSEDGCVTAILGSHKNNIDLDWDRYRNLEMSGAIAVTNICEPANLFGSMTFGVGTVASIN